MTKAAHEPTAALSFVALRFRMHSCDLTLPVGMGALWRSALGQALAGVDAEAFDALFGCGQQSRLFALRPPLCAVRADTPFEWGVTLFGPSVRHANAVVDAVRAMGVHGIGQGRQQALLLCVEDARSSCWSFDGGCCRPVQSIRGDEWWRTAHARLAHVQAAALRIECLTPVAFKDGNAWMESAPTLQHWVRRILGRTAQLAQAAGQFNPIGKERAMQYLAWASEARPSATDHHRTVTLRRRSARSGHRMRLPTQLGTFEYVLPTAQRLLPLFDWAQLIQVGGKTAFGCGVIRATLLQEPVARRRSGTTLAMPSRLPG